jgi:hypothetical protein
VSDLVKSFSDRCDSKIVHWQEKLKKLSERGSVVLWGSGSKAVAFLGMVDQDNVINKVIDINPYRQNHFMPGTGQPIIAPAELQKEQPAAVIIMNAVYSKEISAELDNMGISAEVLAL